MEEEREFDWLDGQTITIPVEKFIEMRLEKAKAEQDRIESIHEKWEIRDKYEELQKAYDKLKEDYQKVLGIKEGETDEHTV